MAKTILPSGEELNVTPEEILRYLNPDGLRQLLRQERLRWHLKVNKDCDYYDNDKLFRYAGSVHNGGYYQRMEIRTFPDNEAFAGYAGVNVDSGVFGIPHMWNLWDKAMSDESLQAVINRVMIGSVATVPGMHGHGVDADGNMSSDTDERSAALVCDPYDGRIYALTNDNSEYVNNETRADDSKIPGRTVARMLDIPTRSSQLINDIQFVSDPDYHHTDNNFTHSNKYILDNIDDRTFVYPEIAKDKNGRYITNIRMGLNGQPGYAESDGSDRKNNQPDPYGDRAGEDISHYNEGSAFSGLTHSEGYLPGIFRSLEELEKVDLLGQKQLPRTHRDAPGAKRATNYYTLDGRWSSYWYDRITHPDSYLAVSMTPVNMEKYLDDVEPVPYGELGTFDRSQLYQWRYNRVEIKYPMDGISITIVDAGKDYRVGDMLRWVFGDDVFIFEVLLVGPNGQIQSGRFIPSGNGVYDQDPSTHGIGVEFTNTSSTGYGAKLAISSTPEITCNTTQLKNNLYAYVDVTPTVRSDNSTEWSDVNFPDTQGGLVCVRSTAAGPAYSGINSGKGGQDTDSTVVTTSLYEHGGNATAGVSVHLFRYVINTQSPTWKIVDNVQVFTGKWVDQGPLGLERPCDIKALLFSNPDTNNFNNYYKFTMDILLDNMNRNPDGVVTHNPNAASLMYIHKAQTDPADDTRFYSQRVNSVTSMIERVDITENVLYVNLATGVTFVYNSQVKNDPTFGYGYRGKGWIPLAGTITK